MILQIRASVGKLQYYIKIHQSKIDGFFIA